MKLIINLSTKLSLVLVMLAGSASLAVAQQYTNMTRIGTSQSVCLGGIETADELRDFFAKNPGAARSIVSSSGWAGRSEDLLDAIANGQLIERTYDVGSLFAWTSAKVRGQYVAKPYRRWAGKAPFEAFQVDVRSGCQIYHIAIPKACCNISLVSSRPDNSEACRPKPVVRAPAPAPAPVEPAPAPKPAKKALALIPFVGALVGTETRARFEPVWAADVRDSSGIAGLKAGLLKPVGPRTAVFGQITGVTRDGVNEFNEFPDESLAIDVGVDRYLSEKIFIGGGVGVYDIDDSDVSEASVFGHIGGDIGKSNFQWLVEGRVFDSDSENLDSINDNKLISVGVRYLIGGDRGWPNFNK